MSSTPLRPDAAGCVLRLGTRKSALALAQSGQVAAALEARHPGLRVDPISSGVRSAVRKGFAHVRDDVDGILPPFVVPGPETT